MESFFGTDDITSSFVAYLGLEFTETTPDRMVASWSADPRLHQPYGLIHGGAHCGVVETLASFGGALWVAQRDPSARVVGVNNNTDFFRGIREGRLTSTATPLHRGRLQQVWVVETIADDGRLAARGQVRLQNLYPED